VEGHRTQDAGHRTLTRQQRRVTTCSLSRRLPQKSNEAGPTKKLRKEGVTIDLLAVEGT